MLQVKESAPNGILPRPETQVIEENGSMEVVNLSFSQDVVVKRMPLISRSHVIRVRNMPFLNFLMKQSKLPTRPQAHLAVLLSSLLYPFQEGKL